MSVKVPANALDRHVAPLLDELRDAADRVIGSGYFILGPNLKAFEDSFAAYCGATHCIGVANGTDALELGLRALGTTTGKRVAVVANAAMYGTAAVIECGAEPVFIDIDHSTLLINPSALEAECVKSPIHAVIVTHLYGRLADMEAILELSKRFGFLVFEDCAQAHGAQDETGRKAGSFGHAASFSFYPTKNLGALGDGGAVVTSDPRTADRVRSLRQYGWTSKYRNELRQGRNSRLDEIQAAMLQVKLPYLDAWNARRRQISHMYLNGIRHPDIILPKRGEQEYVAHLFVIQSKNREALRQHLAASGVGSDIHYPTPDYRQPILADLYEGLSLEVTEAACSEVLTLPCFPELTDDEVAAVIEACNRW